MNVDIQFIKRINFENFIWITFIVISIVDIYGDELIKKSLTTNNNSSKFKAEKLFLFVSLISILIYIYFLCRNYFDYKKYCNGYYKIRLLGSVFVLVGSLFLVYFQLFNSKDQVLPSEI